MPNTLQSAILAAALALVVAQTGPNDLAVKESQHSLEIRLTRLLKWENGCLEVSIDRQNRSTAPIFLPFNGLFIESSVRELTDDPAKGLSEKWRTAYGASDIIFHDVIRLGPGESRHDDYCVGPTIAVVSMQRKSRREVPLRGRLQIYALCYPPEQDWEISKAQREEMARTPPAKWKNADRQRAQSTMLEVSIPCFRAGCAAECADPPVVLEDEAVWVPDITYNDEAYITRGRGLDEELAKKFPQCRN
jgi:hypothetical protein